MSLKDLQDQFEREYAEERAKLCPGGGSRGTWVDREMSMMRSGTIPEVGMCPECGGLFTVTRKFSGAYWLDDHPKQDDSENQG